MLTHLLALPLPEDRADRILAVACALHLLPAKVVADGASNVGKVTDLARRFHDDWLAKAEGDLDDAELRRLLLVLACEKAEPGTEHDQIRRFCEALRKDLARKR